jgi:hypothetical protein
MTVVDKGLGLGLDEAWYSQGGVCRRLRAVPKRPGVGREGKGEIASESVFMVTLGSSLLSE